MNTDTVAWRSQNTIVMEFPVDLSPMDRTITSFATKQLLGAREHQEDAVAASRIPAHSPHAGETLLLLADGLGGHVAGARASRLAIETFTDSFRQNHAGIPESLKQALEGANLAIEQDVARHAEYTGMGTTFVGAVIRHDLLYWISVGDSLLWLLRDGGLTRLDADHSMVPILEGLVELGRLSMEDAARDARRHQLLSALTGREIAMIDLCAAPVSLQKGDIAILASDGIETLTPERIADHFQHRRHASLETIATSLLMEIMEIARPEQANTSLVLCSVGD